jgi:predicted chitinase
MKHLKSREEFINENNAAWDYFLNALGVGGSSELSLGESPVSGTVKYNISGDKGKNIQILLDTMEKHGITNPYTKVAILGVVGKESGFVPQNETPYRNTSNARIRKIFGSRVKGLSDSQLDALKSNDVKFWDRVYGPDDPTGKSQKYGNTQPGDGDRYKGRGLNGITFKRNYERFQKLIEQGGKLGRSVNIVSNPESLNDIEVAAEVAILYFIEAAKSPAMKSKYGVSGLNEFKDKRTAIKAMANANAGWGKNMDTHPLQPHKKAEAVAQNFNIDSEGKVSMA